MTRYDDYLGCVLLCRCAVNGFFCFSVFLFYGPFFCFLNKFSLLVAKLTSCTLLSSALPPPPPTTVISCRSGASHGVELDAFASNRVKSLMDTYNQQFEVRRCGVDLFFFFSFFLVLPTLPQK